MASAPETVLLTRSRPDNALLARRLGARGIAAVSWTGVRAEPLLCAGDPAELQRAVEAADVVAFTSRRGILAARRIAGRALLPLLRARRIAAVGGGTAALLGRLGVRTELVGDRGAEALGERLAGELAPGTRVLLLRGREAGDAPAPALRRAGMLVDDRRVYRLVEPAAAEPAGDPAVIACASPSAARRLLTSRPELRARRFVAIGATTAAALRELGVQDVRVAASPDPDALCDAIAGALDAQSVKGPR